MRKIVLVVHTSIDGFVAGEKGEFDNFNPSPENLDFVCSLTDEADTVLAGRVSYQMLESSWPSARDKPNATRSEIKYSNWYNDADKIVISNTLAKKSMPNVLVINENIAAEINKIKARDGKNILLFGSPATFQMLSDLNLIDEYRIILYPAIFGKGIPLVSGNQIPKRLKLLKTNQLSNGEIVLSYEVEPVK